MDARYPDAPLLVESSKEYDVALCGPVARDGSWQAVAGQGYDQIQFAVNRQAQQVTCPQGKVSSSWLLQKDSADNDVIAVKFSMTDCKECAVRSACTRSRSGRRELGLRPHEQYEALQSARQQQKT